MQTAPARIVHSRGEWDQFTGLGAPLYHSWSWTAQAVARLKRQVDDDVTVRGGYLRIWIGGSPTSGEAYTIIGCPVIDFDGRLFNTPRSSPLVIVGTRLCAACAVKKHMADVELHDDGDQVAAIAWTHLRIEAEADSVRVWRNLTGFEWARMDKALVFPGVAARTAWFDAVRRSLGSSGWVTTIEEHSRSGRIHGYVVKGTTDTESVTLAAARVHEYPPPWGSPR